VFHAAVNDPVEHVLHRPGQLAIMPALDHPATALEGVKNARSRDPYGVGRLVTVVYNGCPPYRLCGYLESAIVMLGDCFLLRV